MGTRGEILISSGFWKLYLWKNGIWPAIHELEQFQGLSPAAARQDLAARLLTLVQYFGGREDTLPEWREAARIRDADQLWELWPSLPITTKNDLVTRFVPPAEIPRRFGLEGRVNCSGGSTGEPTHFFQDTGMIRAGTAATLFCRMRLGWRPGMPLISMWGADRDLGKAGPSEYEQRMARLRNDWVIAGYKVDESTVDRFLGLLRRRHPAAVFGYTSILEFVARRVLERGEQVPPGWVRTAWNGAEMMFESQSELFRRAFGVPLLNWYGSRELSVVAHQRRSPGPLEIVRPHMLIELVNGASKPASAGEAARLVVTCTVCRGTPFIRYEIGDMGTFAARDQDESGLRALATLEGRNAGLLTLANGKVINSLFWNQIFKEFAEIHQFQVMVCREPGLELRFIGEGMAAEREASLRRVLENFTTTIPVRIVWMERLPVTRQGKLVQVVHEAAT